MKKQHYAILEKQIDAWNNSANDKIFAGGRGANKTTMINEAYIVKDKRFSIVTKNTGLKMLSCEMPIPSKHWTKEMLKENELNLIKAGDTVEDGITVIGIEQQTYLNLTHCDEIIVNTISKYNDLLIANCVYKFNKSVKRWKTFSVTVAGKRFVAHSVIKHGHVEDVLLTDKQKKRIIKRIKQSSK